MSRPYKILAPFLMILLVLSACGFGADSPDAQMQGETPNQPATTTDGIITIGFAAQEWQRESYQALIEQFNSENPDVRVQFISLDELTRFDPNEPFDPATYQRRVVSGADTATTWGVSADDINQGFYADLTPLMDADATFDRSDYYPAALGMGSFNGGTYMLPSVMRIPLLQYNRDLWAASNLPEPDPNWTWNDMIGAAEQIARRNGNQISTYGFVDFSGTFITLFAELERNGINMFEVSPEEVRLDDPQIITAVERVAALAEAGAIYAQTDDNTGRDNMEQLILEGQAGLWATDTLRMGGPEPQQAPFEIGVAPYPITNLPFFSVTEGFIMSSGTQHPQEAWRWLSFLSRQEGQALSGMGADPSAIPARISQAESSGYWNELDPAAASAIEATLQRPPTSPFPMNQYATSNLFGILFESMTTVLQGEDATGTMQAAQLRLEDELAQIQLTPQPTPDTGPIVVSTPVPDVAAEGATTIRFIATDGFGSSEARRVAREFNQNNPDIFVSIQEPNYETGVSLPGLAETADCFTWWTPPTTEELTTTLDLQPLIDADANFPRDDYPQALLEPFRDGTRLLGLPYMVEFRTLNYNVTAFEAAGLERPDITWGPNEFLNAAQQLTNGSGADERFGFVSSWQTEDLNLFNRLLGAEPTRGSGSNETPNYTDPQVVQAARFFVDLLRDYTPHEGLFGYSNNSWGDDTYQYVFEGRAGMWFEYAGQSFFGSGDFEMGVAPLPLGGRALGANDFRSNGLFISAQTEHAQECWTWLQHLSADVSDLRGRFPARISVVESEAFQTQAQSGSIEVFRAYTEALANNPLESSATQEFDPEAVYLDTFWYHRAIDRALQGADLEREMTEAQRLAEEYLDCARTGNQPAHECANQVDPDYEGFQTEPMELQE